MKRRDGEGVGEVRVRERGGGRGEVCKTNCLCMRVREARLEALRSTGRL